tara:strand:+ start:3255 stop:3917 length:663 start_codon:yes stop_codon:yes gene_type:complete
MLDYIIFGIIDNAVMIFGAFSGLEVEKAFAKKRSCYGAVIGAGLGNALSDFLGGLGSGNLTLASGTAIGCLIGLLFIPLCALIQHLFKREWLTNDRYIKVYIRRFFARIRYGKYSDDIFWSDMMKMIEDVVDDQRCKKLLRVQKPSNEYTKIIDELEYQFEQRFGCNECEVTLEDNTTETRDCSQEWNEGERCIYVRQNLLNKFFVDAINKIKSGIFEYS